MACFEAALGHEYDLQDRVKHLLNLRFSSLEKSESATDLLGMEVVWYAFQGHLATFKGGSNNQNTLGAFTLPCVSERDLRSVGRRASDPGCLQQGSPHRFQGTAEAFVYLVA